MFKLKNSNDNVILGDSVEVSTYGYVSRGFVFSHFVTSRDISNNCVTVVSYVLVEPNNKFVFFQPQDTIKTTRIVLTEKNKIHPSLNEEFNYKLHSAEILFKNRQSFHKYRQIGASLAFASSVFYSASFKQ
jgi:hypothetical protein